MKNTIKNLLIAQNYSDAAKDINMIGDDDLHAKKIVKIFENSSELEVARDNLYYEKSLFLIKAMKSAKKEKVDVIYDESEGCLYFEFSFGQCSFHYFDELEDNVSVVDEYKWNGEKNTGQILRENYTKQK